MVSLVMSLRWLMTLPVSYLELTGKWMSQEPSRKVYLESKPKKKGFSATQMMAPRGVLEEQVYQGYNLRRSSGGAPK